jgi:hypothetical protein
LNKISLESEKNKLQTDVEKLIKNQEMFEMRVKEMDEVYAMLLKEKDKV